MMAVAVRMIPGACRYFAFSLLTLPLALHSELFAVVKLLGPFQGKASNLLWLRVVAVDLLLPIALPSNARECESPNKLYFGEKKKKKRLREEGFPPVPHPITAGSLLVSLKLSHLHPYAIDQIEFIEQNIALLEAAVSSGGVAAGNHL